MEQKTFVELFAGFRRYCFYKCDGQIPYYFAKELGYVSTIYTFHDDDYESLPIKIPGFQIKVMGKKDIFGKNLNKLTFILSNAKKIDILYQYHFAVSNFVKHALYTILYKLINPRGKVFMRFEADLAYTDTNYPWNEKTTLLKHFFRKIIYHWYFHSIDVFGIADFSDFRTLKKFPYLYSKTIKKSVQQLNGFSNDSIQSAISKVKPYADKRNIIVTAGRLHFPVKGVDIFLKALETIDLGNWEVYLIGSEEDAFIEQLNKFYKDNPKLRNKVKSTGYMKTRREYYDLLNNSKIFVLPSRFDGMPHVVPEAMALGNVIVASNHHGIRVATEEGNVGRYFKVGDANELAQKLIELIHNENLLESLSYASLRKAHEEFEWGQIVKHIHKTTF